MFMSMSTPKKGKQSNNIDAGIQAEAWIALWKADDLRSLDISGLDLKVQDGDVWLTGRVHNAHQRHLAENLVKAVPGVNRVYNELAIDSGS